MKTQIDDIQMTSACLIRLRQGTGVPKSFSANKNPSLGAILLALGASPWSPRQGWGRQSRLPPMGQQEAGVGLMVTGPRKLC